MNRRKFFQTSSIGLVALNHAKVLSRTSLIDLAYPDHRNAWFNHPVVGDPSFDAFTRLPNNPVYRGRPPFEWPVNGFFFIDPVSGFFYCYIGLYPRGYWPPGGCRLLRSRDHGESWLDLGVVLSGTADSFDGDGKNPGGTPDVSVCYADGAYK